MDEDNGFDNSPTEQESVSEESPEQLKIITAFELSASDDNNGEDEIKMAMLMAGCKFKKVSALYKTLMVDAGFMASSEEKKKAVSSAIDAFDVGTQEGFEDAVSSVINEVTGINETAASNAIRAMGKKDGIDVYTKPKGAPRAAGFKHQYFKALRENPQMGAEESDTLVKSLGSENDYKHLSLYQTIRQLCNDIASDHA